MNPVKKAQFIDSVAIGYFHIPPYACPSRIL